MRLGESLKIGVLSIIVIVIPLSATSEPMAHPASRHSSRDYRLRGLLPATVPSASNSHPRFVRTPAAPPADFDRTSLANFLSGDWESEDPSGNKETYQQLRPYLDSKPPTVGPTWYFTGLGYFARGGRGDSNFIRLGRNNAGSSYTPPSSNHPNKKNNFIRLGRENLRQNNFIRLGRGGGGFWDTRERFVQAVGFLPEYMSSPLASPQMLPTGELISETPLSPDNPELSRHG